MAICLCKSAPTQLCLRLPAPAGPMLVNKRTRHSVRQPTDRSARQGCDIEAVQTINRTDDPKSSKRKTGCAFATSISHRSPFSVANWTANFILTCDIPYEALLFSAVVLENHICTLCGANLQEVMVRSVSTLFTAVGKHRSVTSVSQ